MQEIKGHKPDQPGLRGHSHDPENDLMKQFVVAKKVKHGWLWLQSFNTYDEAYVYAYDTELWDYTIIDQFKEI